MTPDVPSAGPGPGCSTAISLSESYQVARVLTTTSRIGGFRVISGTQIRAIFGRNQGDRTLLSQRRWVLAARASTPNTYLSLGFTLHPMCSESPLALAGIDGAAGHPSQEPGTRID